VTNSGAFSLNSFAGHMDEPANNARLKLIVGDDTTQKLINLRHAAQDALAPPMGTDVTSYKTGKSLAGLQESGNFLKSFLPHKAQVVMHVADKVKQSAREAGAADAAVGGVPISKMATRGMATKTQNSLGAFEQRGAAPLSVFASQPDSSE
jgi:hypothetical protein